MKRKTKVYVYNFVVVMMLITAIVWVVSRFVHLGNIEFTNNAYVHRQVTPVNSRVSGFIKEIRFGDYQPVDKGDTIAVIEDSEFRVQLAQSEAALINAMAEHEAALTSVATMESNVGVSKAAVTKAKAQLEIARRDDERYERLFERGAVTQSEYDRIHTAYISAAAHYDGLIKNSRSTSLTKKEMKHRVEQSEAAIRSAQAAIDMAKINLSYTVVIAPCNGVAGKKNLNEGQLVQPGQTLLDIVDSSEIWIVANFREKQMKNICEGAEVKIKIDAYPDMKLSGKVESVSDATGSAVSMIPTDNAVGNFVKVEQRIPVRIGIDAESSDCREKLRAGMSAECEVKY